MKGIRRHGLGWQASVSVSGVGRAYQAFPIDTTEEEMQRWRSSTRARLELQRSAVDRRAPAGTFAADAQRYLASVTAMPDYKGRVYDIGLWVLLFGHRRSATIQAHEIRAQRDRWLKYGPKRMYNRHTRAWDDQAVPLAASTVNHRLRALENMYTVLWPNRENPVRQVPEADEPDPEDRSIPHDVIEAILALMPDRGRGIKGHARSTVSQSKARIRLMAYTGLTHAQLMALGRGDLDAELPAVRLARRRKGKGVAGGWKPLPAEAIPAIRQFVAAEAWGRFSRDALRQSWRRACVKFFGPDAPLIRPYDLRHSYAGAVLDATGSLTVTQHLLSHADPRTTERYAARAIPEWLRSAMAKVSLVRQRIVPNPENK
jgi:integrase